MKWVKHPVVEQNLKQLGIKFEVEENIPKSAIDLDLGWKKQVRLSKEEEMNETILRYAAKMLEDTAWNMVVLQKDKNKYWPWSGNQRLAAFDLAGVGDTISAYVVKITDPVMEDLLPRLVNTWEAVVGMTKAEAVANARWMKEKHGMSVQEAAKLFGVKPDQVYLKLRIEDSKQKLSSFSIPYSGFSDNILDHLGRIKNTNIMKRTASIMRKYQVKGLEATQFIDDVREGTTESQQGVILDRWESTFDLRENKPSKTPTVKLPHKQINRDRLFTLVTSLARFLQQVKTVTQAQLTDPVTLQTVKNQWQTIVPVMDNLLNGGEK